MTKRIDEVGALGNIAGLAAGAKGAVNGAANGKGVFGKIGGAIQGAKEGSAKKKGAWALKQWARKLKVDFLRHSGAMGDTPEAFKNYVDNAYKLNITLPGASAPAAGAPAAAPGVASASPAAAASPHAFGAGTPASYGGGQFTNQSTNANVAAAGPSFKSKTTVSRPYPQQYTPTAPAVRAAAPVAPAAAPVAPAAAAATKPRISPNTVSAISALKNLGYKTKEATAAVMGIAHDPSMTTPNLIRNALKSMGGPAMATPPDPTVNLSSPPSRFEVGQTWYNRDGKAPYTVHGVSTDGKSAEISYGDGKIHSVLYDKEVADGYHLKTPAQTSEGVEGVEGVISPRLGLYAEKSFTQLISEGAIIITEDSVDDWCRSAAQQLLTKYPWLLDASVKYKVGSPQFATYLQKMHDDYGYDFGGNRAPAARAPVSAQSARGNPASQQQQQQTPTTSSTQKIAAALQNCRLPARLAPKVEEILNKASKAGANIDLTKELNNIGIDDKSITKLLALSILGH